MKWRRKEEDGDTEKHTNTGSEPKVTNFIQNIISVFVYNVLFYRVRRGLMAKRRDGCTRIRIYATLRYSLPPYVDL